MRRLFVDTSAWCAIEDGHDANHVAALQFKEEITGACDLVTTDYVLDETYTLLLLNLGHERTVAFHGNIEHLVRAGILHLVQVSPGFSDAAWQVFAQFNVDKQWSFTDCTSYVVMQHLGIGEAFAFDHHFEQMRLVRQP